MSVPTDTTGAAAPDDTTGAGRQRASHSEYGVAVLLLALGTWAITDAQGLVDQGARGFVNSKTLPTVVGALLVLTGILLAVNVFRGGHGEAEGGEDVDLSGGTDYRTLGLLVASFVANALLIDRVGWPISGAILFFGSAFALPPLLEMRIDPLQLGIAALGIYTATYVAETIRSGINTVPVGQAEAARALGLTFGQVMSLVVMPQAFRSVIPPMMSVFIALLKNTTVAAGFSVLNLGSIRAYLSERGESQMAVILWVMVIFIALVLLLSWLQRRLEIRWKVAR